MSLNYSYNHDNSYANYNNINLPWKINTSYIYHNNQTINSSLKLGAIKNNLVIESSQNDIMLITPQNNKKVIAKNSMTINNDLDISNILKTNFINAKDVSLTGLLHTGNLTIIGNIDLLGRLSYRGGTSVGDISESETRFRGVNFINNSMFYDVSITNTDLFLSDFSNMNIFNSYIYNSPIGYTISNNSAPAKAVFSDVSLYTLVLDSSLNSKRYIKFSNSNSNIIIKSSDDYSKLEISKPLNLNVGFSFEQAVTNISNISVFHGDISCVKLYYSHLVPDIKLNNYFDVSIGHVSVSGNIIPSVNNRFNIGSSNYNFTEINSNQFIGDLSGRVPYAYNLIKNLDMSFNNLDIYGTFTLNGSNLNQFLSGELTSISKSITDFSNVNKRVSDLSISLYSKADFDLCLNSNFAKISLRDTSFDALNNKITSISASVYSKSEFDLCLNRNLLRINDVSAIVAVVTHPARIYPRLGYIDSSLNKVTNAKVSNELVFPYAITYVDDNVEDTNIKESYSYRQATTVTTFNTTTTKTTTITYSYETRTRRVSGTEEPNNLGETRLTMWSASSNDIYRRTWNDVNGVGAGPAVYKITLPGAIVSRTFELNTTNYTWDEHRRNAITVPGRSLASILNITENNTIVNLRNAWNSNAMLWLGGRRMVFNTSDGGAVAWEWVNGDRWSYTNWNSEQPDSNDYYMFLSSYDNKWHDDGRDIYNTTRMPAVYVTVTYAPATSFYRVATTNPTYQFISTPMTWQQHQDAAVSSGRNLAVILNSQQQTIVANLIPSNTYGPVYIGGRRINNNTNNGTSTEWEWVTGDPWNYTNWTSDQPDGGSNETKLEIIHWVPHDVWKDTRGNEAFSAVYMTGSHNNILNLSWEGHRLNAIAIGAELAVITSAPENEAVGNAAQNAGLDTVYIGGRRKLNSANAYGITSDDWEWHNGTAWSYSNFFGGRTEQYEHRIDSQPSESSPQIGQPVQVGSPTTTYVNFDVSNVKLPLLVSSSNGSIVATATAINVPSIPSNPTPSNSNSEIISNIDTTNTTRASSITTNTIIRRHTTTTITYSLNSGLTTGSFKISDNSNNNSNYISPFSINTILTTYSCIAISDDGMFVALGKASEVTVYMRNSSTSGWTTIGSSISVNFTAYTGTGVGIIPTQFTENWRKNLKNLAINFNYNTGSTTSQLLLAFGDTINIIKVYSYSNGTWTFPNGFYSVAGGSWGNTLTTYSAATLGVSTTTNFGYFVTLSQSPSVLGFTVDDRFYTYNCTTTNNTIRGSAKTLPISFSSATKNIVAFKMSSDADKIIVSNTHYVFIYKWINTDFSNINNISYLASAITFNYGSFTNISAAPRSLDISNISSNNNDCVFAIGFPDVIIDVSNNKKARGYVEYWKLINNTLTRLAILVPRKRNIDSSNVDTDEYFFSAGGIKITNANTILVAPNFKFHFNSTNKKYELDPRSTDWTTHNSRSTDSRLFASIQNEVENELVKICARNNSVWIGGKRVANPINARGKTSIDWEWVTPDPWIYQNFRINQPDNTSERGLEFTNSGWTDLATSNNRQAIFMTLPLQYSLKNTFTIFDNRFYFHSSGFSSTYCPNAISSTVIARWYSRSTSTPPTNSNTINFSANGRIVSNSKGALTLSDIRLKENIVDTTPKLADLLKVRVVNYNLKGSDGKKLIGVIAQELEQLFPSLVKDGELSLYDINHGKTESYKSVKYSCFDIILIKAFQEQMAIINKLSSQLDEIEGKTKILKAISEELALLKNENELFKLNINEILKLI